MADLVKRVEWYETRWVVEELHKGQKTGCSIVSVQMGKQNHDERGKPARKDWRRPATEWFSQQEQEVLAGGQYGDSRREMTLAEFCRVLAMLGATRDARGTGCRDG